ncbi:MAG: flavin reductase family protein [Hyphomicrobiaceae bacterium]
MFYETAGNAHGLPRDPFKSLVVPRPIGWVSSLDREGVLNLAPYSYFNAVSDNPHYVVLGSSHRKDSLNNILETGEFVCSMATFAHRVEQNVTSADVAPAVNEFDIARLETAASRLVAPPRVAGAPAALECKLYKTFDLPAIVPGGKAGYTMIVGYVVGVYIDDAFIKNGFVDTAAMQPIARLGYMDYATVTPESTFTLNRPQLRPDGSIG